MSENPIVLTCFYRSDDLETVWNGMKSMDKNNKSITTDGFDSKSELVIIPLNVFYLHIKD